MLSIFPGVLFCFGHQYIIFCPSFFFFDWVVPFFWVLCYMKCLYISEINPLLVISFAYIFSYYEGCLFFLFMVSFVMKKLLSLIKSHVFVFVFIFVTVGGGARRYCCTLSQGILLVFFFNRFILSSITFRPLSQFKFTFVCGGWQFANFIILYVAVQCSEHHFLKRLFSPLCILASFAVG